MPTQSLYDLIDAAMLIIPVVLGVIVVGSFALRLRVAH